MIRTCFHDFEAPTKGTVYEDPTTDNLFKLFQTKNSILYVAEINNIAVGCCGLYPTEGLQVDCIELVKFYLSKQFRSKGIGKKLFEKCLEKASNLGFKHIYIESLPEFGAAVELYKLHQFYYLQFPKGNSGHPGCTIWMQKDLT